MRHPRRVFLLAAALAFGLTPITRAQETRPAGQTILIEAETLTAAGNGKRITWGENDYKANFANANLSRQAGFQLGKPQEGNVYTAAGTVDIPAPGKYMLLVRYEAPLDFDFGFEVVVTQNGQTFKKTFGLPENKKLWPFGEGFKADVIWDWSANENIVWEGQDFEVVLAQGPAQVQMRPIRTRDKWRNEHPLIAFPESNRNIDCLLFTSDVEGLKLRLEKETNMPLASWLTQSGDLWVRVVNKNSESPVKVTLPDMASPAPGEKREAVVLDIPAGQTSGWVEAGGLLQTFTPSRWALTAVSPKPVKGAAPEPDCLIEFATPSPGGPVAGRRFDFKGRQLELAYEPNLRDVGLERGLKPIREVLLGYLAELEKVEAPGKAPTHVPVSAISFPHRAGDAQYNAAVDRFNALLGLNAPSGRRGSRDEPPVVPGGVILPFGKASTENMKQSLDAMKAKGQLTNVAGFMIGSETSNNLYPVSGEDEGFRAFLKARGIKPSEADFNAGDDWSKVHYLNGIRDRELSDIEEYHQAAYEHELKLREVSRVADIFRQYVPDALIAINFNSYMVPSEKAAPCLGPTYSFAQTFRRKALTLPWIQDYMFWMPVGSHVMQFLNVDLMRAGIRHYPRQAMAASIMPQSPGNNPRSWRRMFYGHMAHGVNRFDLFQISPIQVGNLRYHVTDSRMFAEIRKVTHELGSFDDLLVDAKVGSSDVGFYFSEYGDLHGSWQGQDGAAKIAFYAALKLANVPLDAVIEDDVLDDTLARYKALILCDAFVSPKALEKIKVWVENGGVIIAVRGVGAWQSDASGTLDALLGCELSGGLGGGAYEDITAPLSKDPKSPGRPMRVSAYHKQEMMNLSSPLAVTPADLKTPILNRSNKVFWSCRFLTPLKGAEVLAHYRGEGEASASPEAAIVATRRADGTLKTLSYGFFPGLQGFKSDRPIGRYDAFETPGHSTVTEMLDPAVRALVTYLQKQNIAVPRARVTNTEFIETGWIQSPTGILIPVIDWGNRPITRTLKLELALDNPQAWVATDHIGQALKLEVVGTKVMTEVQIDGAGAIALRKK